jgi:hypothetical protein
MPSLKFIPALALTLALCASVCAQSMVSSNPAANKLNYPAAKKSDHVDEYHGTKVADP